MPDVSGGKVLSILYNCARHGDPDTSSLIVRVLTAAAAPIHRTIHKYVCMYVCMYEHMFFLRTITHSTSRWVYDGELIDHFQCVLYCIVLYCIVLYFIVLQCIVLYSIIYIFILLHN